MPKLTFLPPMLSGGRPDTRFSTSSLSFLLYTDSQQTACVATTETLNLQSYLQRQTLIPINMARQRGTGCPHISLQDWDLCFQWLNLLFIKGQNATANWSLQSKLKKSHLHRTIRMGRCFLLKVSHHWQWKVSSTPTFESFPSSGSKAQLMAEEAIFLQKREFWIRSNLNTNMHDLKEKKTHNFIFHIMLSTDKGKRIIQHFRAWADRNKIEICLKICHLREELLTLLWHWEEGE